jgi:hypothetical protein
MTEEAADSAPKEKSGKSSPARKSVSWMQLGIAGVFVAVLIAVVHYTLSYQHENTFDDARAFRVLEELVAQIRNLESSRATLLGSLPPPIPHIAPWCTGPMRDRPIDGVPPKDAQRYYTGYLGHLDFTNTELCAVPQTSPPRPSAETTTAAQGNPKATVDSANSQAKDQLSPVIQSTDIGELVNVLCSAAHTGSVSFNVNVRDDRLTTVSCDEKPYLVLRESLERAVNKFISQDFFEESILTLADGTVVGEFPMQSATAPANTIILHRAIADRLNMISARAVLHPPPPAGNSKNATDGSSGASGKAQTDHLEPFAWSTTIAEQPYRVFVLPFNAPYRVTFTGVQASPKKDHLYLLGLHRSNGPGEILHALWPTGLWAAVLLISLNLVAWPLISLAFGPAEESISVGRALGCVAGLILIPALLVIAAASMWSDMELQSWMRVNARDYATQISSQLRQNLVDGGTILNSFRSTYKLHSLAPQCAQTWQQTILGSGGQKKECINKPALFGYDSQQSIAACGITETVVADGCDDVQLLPASEVPVESRWSPFRSILAVNENGERKGPALSPFKAMYVSPEARIPDREYFQALKAGQGWMVENDSQAESLPIVAQRLYNKGDASKALQLAVPLCDPRDTSADSRFCGVITGDIRMYGLTSPVSPPLLKFAVIDNATGTVVFSSTDTRSLSENFFRESEENPALLAVIKSHREADFVGTYLGEPQRFYYTPIRNVPWGVLVFYSRKELADLPFRAGSAALASYVGLLLAFAVVVSVVWWLCLLLVPALPRPLALLKWLWPHPSLAEYYGRLSRFRPFVWGVLALLLGMLFSLSALTTFVSSLMAMAAAASAGWVIGPDPPTNSMDAQPYSQCVLMVVMAVSILPAYALFVGFHKLQYNALIRDGLVENAAQIQSRYDAVHEELRRLLPPDGRGWKDSVVSTPSLWSLSLCPNIGMSDVEHDGPISTQISMFPPSTKTLRTQLPNLHQRLVWEWTASSPEQQRRFAITNEPLTDRESEDMQCGLDPESEKDTCVVRMSDGSRLQFKSTAELQSALFANEFEWSWPRIAAIFAAVLFAAMGTSFFSWLVTTRLLGLTDKLAQLSSVAVDPAIEGKPFPQKWNSLKDSERLALYQIARRELVNPRNFAVLEAPARAGMIRLEPWPEPASAGMKKSILDAAPRSDFAKLQREAADSVWRKIRGPLFVVLMVVIAWLSWAAGGSMKALMAVLVATVAFVGQLLQLVNFARGSGSAPKSPQGNGDAS